MIFYSEKYRFSRESSLPKSRQCRSIRRKRRVRCPVTTSSTSPLFLLFLLLCVSIAPPILVADGSRFLASPFRTTNAARKMLLSMAERKDKGRRRKRIELDDEGDDEDLFSRSFPALNIQQSGGSLIKKCQDVSIKFKKRVVKLRMPPVAPFFRTGGGFYGVSPKTVDSFYSVDDDDDDDDDATTGNKRKKKRPPRMKESMSQALDELRLMRIEMEALRRELHDMKRRVTGEEVEEMERGEVGALTIQERKKKQKRLREFETIASDVEKWAEDLLFRNNQDDDDVDGQKASEVADNDGWIKFQCNKMFEQTFNSKGQTSAYLKWMKDSRGKYARQDDNREYPCIRVYTTLDAPFDEVCLYLSESSNIPEYNDLVVKHKDLEVLSPHSKICWGQTPQLLFIKPRDLITFCQHRWLRDGSQLVINQAYDDDYESSDDDSSGKKKVKSKNPKAYALRGANIITPHPDDPSKTQIRILCHANPGDDVPQWAARTAVNSLLPSEPFKLFHKINQGIIRHREDLQKKCQLLQNIDETEMVSTGVDGGNAVAAPDKIDGTATTRTEGGKRISRRPAGLSQLGYACFWPDGGGIEEGGGSRRIMTKKRDDDLHENGSDQPNSATTAPAETTTSSNEKQTSVGENAEANSTTRAQDSTTKNVEGEGASTNKKKEAAIPSS